MKITTRNIMQILRLYKVALPDEPVRSIRNLVISDEEYFVRASLVINKQRYMILFGSEIDETNMNYFWPDKPDEAMALANPLDPDHNVTPFNGKYLMVFHLPPEQQRLDVYLASQFDSSISRSKWQQYIKLGCVTVNGEVKLSSSEDIRDTDEIRVNFPSQIDTNHDLPILYQDEEVIVINKPSGVLTHAKGGIVSESTVADFMKPYTKFGLESDMAGIVHRLDRDTSGVIICARTKQTADFLQKQFSERRVTKVYLAVVDGSPRLEKAKIDLPIGRNPTKPSTFRVDSSGKPAETIYRTLASSNRHTLVELRPTTGRTHQLRVHMAHLGTPIHGDRVYGKIDKGLMLHAYKLTCTLPSGAEQTFTAEIPRQFTDQFPDVII